MRKRRVAPRRTVDPAPEVALKAVVAPAVKTERGVAPGAASAVDEGGVLARAPRVAMRSLAVNCLGVAYMLRMALR